MYLYICCTYLFVCTTRHVGTHVEVSRWVYKHDLESIMEVCQRWLHRMQKERRDNKYSYRGFTKLWLKYISVICVLMF